MGPTRERTVRLTIPARPEFVCVPRRALEELAEARGLPPELLADLKLALTEACANAVTHAYGGGEGTIEVVFELLADRIAFEVADAGPGFDGTAPPAGEPRDGGLGLTIIRALADELELGGRGEPGGARVRFVKLLPV
jgi:serine/threonine-protein kinase RsbW